MGLSGCYKFACLVVRFFIILAYLFVGAAVFRTLEKGKSGNPQWSIKSEIVQYFDWFRFAFSSTTTIGYGDITPRTSKGKLIYIFYSMVGIPLMLWYLALCGQIQTNIYAYVLQNIRISLWRRNDKSYKDIGPVLISIIMLLIFWFVGSITLHKTSSISLLDCVYYWWVTFTTTGFGDITLSMSRNVSHGYSWIVYKWLMLNLVAAVVHSLLVWIHGFSEPKQSMCCICWHESDGVKEGEETLARYNVQLAKNEESLGWHRHTHLTSIN